MQTTEVLERDVCVPTINSQLTKSAVASGDSDANDRELTCKQTHFLSSDCNSHSFGYCYKVDSVSVNFISLFTSCVELQPYPLYVTWASHIAANELMG